MKKHIAIKKKKKTGNMWVLKPSSQTGEVKPQATFTVTSKKKQTRSQSQAGTLC